jgi:hypothetical protein
MISFPADTENELMELYKKNSGEKQTFNIYTNKKHPEETFFDLYELSNVFNYHDKRYLLNYYHRKNNYIDIFETHYTDFVGFSEIANRGRKPGLRIALKEVYCFTVFKGFTAEPLLSPNRRITNNE